MLAQNFKTPYDLDISDAEFDALLKVLGMLERGDLVHSEKPDKPNGFNMDWEGIVEQCGTVACIGGWVALLMDRSIPGYVFGEGLSDELRSLFFPNNSLTQRIPYGNITTGQAAIALRNYPTHGEPRWAEALAE